MTKYTKTIVDGVISKYYREEGDKIIHISHLSNEREGISFINEETGKKTVPKERWLINQVDSIGDQDSTKEEFDLALNTAILELGIYQTTISN